MVYLNFTKIAPDPPNDPTVDEATQLNANWALLDTKLQPYVTGGTITSVEQGQEYIDNNFRFAVYDGGGNVPDDIDAAWSAWTAFPMASGRSVRTSFTPRWRNNSLLRMVECAGGMQYDAAANVFPMGSLVVMNGDVSGSPPLSMLPVGGKFVGQAATALTGGTSVTAGAYIVVDSGTSFVRLSAQYLGGGGGGNFIQLDQVWWWY